MKSVMIKRRLYKKWHGSSVRTKRGVVALGGLLACFVVLNLALYAVFSNRAYPNTRIAQHSIGSVSYGAIVPKLDQFKLLPSSFTLEQATGKVVVTPKDIGVQLDTARIADGVRQRSWLPVENLFKAHNVAVYTKVNSKVLVQKLTSLASSSKQQPTNAQIVINNGQFALAGEAQGSQLNIGRAETTVTTAIARGKSVIGLPRTGIPPTVTGSSLQAGLHELQAQQAVSLSYTYNTKTTKPSAAIIAGWYAQSGSSYSLQPARIQAYINEVGSGYGMRVQNLAAAVTATQQAIQSVKPLSFGLVAVPPGVCSNNSGGQLVVVSISQQHMWACDGYSQVYDTAITSGAYLAGTPTPTGTWHIYSKQTNVVLRGPTWNDPVSYWLPFYSDYGFHDASWQTFPFGDPAYASDGSHGCVHLPTPAMAWLYSWSRIGTTVTITG